METNVKDHEITEQEQKEANQQPLSNTIKNAHASGDGSIKRSDETIDTPGEGSKTPTPPLSHIKKHFMQPLYTANLEGNGLDIPYLVQFHDEAYHFEPTASGASPFFIKREGDEWIASEDLNHIILSAAIASLDKYLLAQH